MICVENLTKSYGGRVLFENISFKVNSRERIGLVGRNGYGKTTLFKIIAGEEEYDGGNLVFPKNYSIGYVRQHLKFEEESILKEGIASLPLPEKEHTYKVEKILLGLGFSVKDFHRAPSSFSGGFQVRLNLAKVLISEPDMLLLDEPTNYLDITSIRWIQRFLLGWQHELMLITHDRSFMDKVVTHVIGIHRQKARKIKGETEKYYSQIAQDEEIYEKTRLNDERKKKEIEQFINRFRAKARLANMVQSRIKTLSKMETKTKLSQQKSLDFMFQSAPFIGKYALSVKDLVFGYDEKKTLIDGLSFTIGAKDRVCVIGRNGQGKTTLLKLLSGTLSPHKGEIKYHPGTIRGSFEQTNVSSLVESRTVEEEIQCSHPTVDRQLVRNVCGAMMFDGDQALKKIGVLSGGEKSRVMLGKVIVTPVNLLLLDEPTNHLDMESSDTLLEAIDSFDGAVIMVTHNEMYLHAIADRLIVFKNEGISLYEGGYQRFLDNEGWQDEDAYLSSNSGIRKEDTGDGKINKKELRQLRSNIIQERSAVIRPIEILVSKKEMLIETYERELNSYNESMIDASQAKDGARISDLSQKIHQCQEAIDNEFSELEKLYDDLEEKKKIFQIRLDQVQALQ